MAFVRGTEGRDTLRGTPQEDTILSLGGDDDIFANAGSDRVEGGFGSDRVFGQDGADALLGGRGNDRLFGGAGIDTLSDRANGPDGNDLFDGGAGRDQVSFENQAVGVNLTLGEGGADSRAVQGGEVDTLRHVESVSGSLGSDTIFGNSSDNTLLSGTGSASDRLFGRGGDDELFGQSTGRLLLDGGSGDDRLVGGSGSARLFGGTGGDTVFASLEGAEEPKDVDLNYLGSDSAADLFSAEIGLSNGFEFGFSTERVFNIGANDRFDISLFDFNTGTSLDAGTFLDSDRNGVVNDADQDARFVGGNLVLDVDQLLEREGDLTVDLGEQHVILQDVARIHADQFV